MRVALAAELGGIDRVKLGERPDPVPAAATLERGITGESFAAHVDRRRLEALRSLVDAGKLRPRIQAVLPLDQARQALAEVAGRHARGKVVLRIGQ